MFHLSGNRSAPHPDLEPLYSSIQSVIFTGLTSYEQGQSRPGEAGTVNNRELQVALFSSLMLLKAAGSGRKILLKNGRYVLHSMLKIPSSVILGGEGSGTVLVPAAGFRDSILIGNVSGNPKNVHLRDFRIQNMPDTGSFVKRIAVAFKGSGIPGAKNVSLKNVSIDNFSGGGVVVKNIDSIMIDNCDVNGGLGALTNKDKLNYNLSFMDCADVSVTNSRLSEAFAGIMVDDCDGVSVIKTDISRNGGYGVRIFGSKNVEVVSSFFEGNDRSALIVEKGGSEKIALRNNIFQYNTGYGVEAYLAREVKTVGNTYLQNRDGEVVVKSSMISVVE
ncbi:MAG: right-handed parallel beta-helix repeat-containing protein [Chitinophagaceae bacterium]|nr:MAG: right-handed parallel beta-helix repeat-containing protein [Chitinophagaceae bacterium]